MIADNVYADKKVFVIQQVQNGEQKDAFPPVAEENLSYHYKFLKISKDIISFLDSTMYLPELYQMIMTKFSLYLANTMSHRIAGDDGQRLRIIRTHAWGGEYHTRELYKAQVEALGYRKLTSTGVAVVGTWDDHDYGVNDSGKEFKWKNVTKELVLDFLQEPDDSRRWLREGIYASYMFGSERGKRLRLILLDTRFARDSIGSDGSMLGEEQWVWLEELFADKDSQADVTLIGTSVQFNGNVDALLKPILRTEGWMRFPSERKRFLKLIAKYEINGILMLSGDVHLGTISELVSADRCGVPYSIIDFTSSGLTHSALSLVPLSLRTISFLFSGISIYKNFLPPDTIYYGDYFLGENWGSLEVDWDQKPSPLISLAVRDKHGKKRITKEVALDSLQFDTSPKNATETSSLSCKVTNTYRFRWQGAWVLTHKGFIVVMIAVDIALVVYLISKARYYLLMSCTHNNFFVSMYKHNLNQKKSL